MLFLFAELSQPYSFSFSLFKLRDGINNDLGLIVFFHLGCFVWSVTLTPNGGQYIFTVSSEHVSISISGAHCVPYAAIDLSASRHPSRPPTTPKPPFSRPQPFGHSSLSTCPGPPYGPNAEHLSSRFLIITA